ncbi:MAG: bL35 family ribosomal protein [Candidatus Shapirobacteria bacterium]
MKSPTKRFKIRKSVSNRFEVTKNGIVLRQSSFNRHLRRNKSKKQLRRLKGKQPVLGRFAMKVRKLLGRA